MQKVNLKVKSFKRKDKKYNSYKGKIGAVAKNRIPHVLNHEKITTDTTEFKDYEFNNNRKMIIKKLYLELFMDLYNGGIFSFSINKRYQLMHLFIN